MVFGQKPRLQRNAVVQIIQFRLFVKCRTIASTFCIIFSALFIAIVGGRLLTLPVLPYFVSAVFAAGFGIACRCGRAPARIVTQRFDICDQRNELFLRDLSLKCRHYRLITFNDIVDAGFKIELRI